MQRIRDNAVKTERDGMRWMMVFYDTIVFVLCWLAVFVLSPPIQHPQPTFKIYLYLIGGYALFFGLRLLLKCYKQILRYGSVRALSREILATVSASVIFILTSVLLGKEHSIEFIPLITLISFVSLYIVICFTARLGYHFLYEFAKKNTQLSHFVRRMLEVFAFVSFESDKPGATLHLVLESEMVQASPINKIQNIAVKFAIDGEIVGIIQINKGYINQTFRVETSTDTNEIHKYILQRINDDVFPDVPALMDNYILTTNHLHDKFRLSGSNHLGSVQMIFPTKNGDSYLNDKSGYWRMFTYFDNVHSQDIPDRPETFYYAGCAFGKFVLDMSDVDVNDVKIVIPNFHNTMSRYRNLEEAIIRDSVGRVKSVLPEIEFVRARADRFGLISDALESGRIPTRICHNDCNLNNILFDNKSSLPVAIIDLDTVMPSSPLYDYGDSMRIGTNTAMDDEKDLTKVSCDLNLYEQYALGYLEACGSILTKEELRLLPYASLIITAEDGIRFLMDHIDGDTYYKIFYPGQNLDRARTQLKLMSDMEMKLPMIKQILNRIYAKLNLEMILD